MHNSPFTVAGMSSSTNAHHTPNLNTWGSTSTGGPLASSFSDTLSQSRSHYQAGYLMVRRNAPPGNQRVDEVPIVPTKAKMNHVLSRGSTSDFGMDSMFQSSRQRPTLTDEDAPPTNSINDIPNENHFDSSPARFQPRNSTLDGALFPRRHTRAPSIPQPSQLLYIVVFGYPADKFSITVEYFRSLGECTEADQNLDVLNCFRIGYTDPGDALRAVRKNGEVLGGSWMIGAKWADPAQAEAMLGQPVFRNGVIGHLTDPNSPSNAMAVDENLSPMNSTSNTPTVGTPIKLAPAASAFRRTGVVEKPTTPQPQRGWGPSMPGVSAPSFPSTTTTTTATSSQNKGMLGQMSDLIFGW
ncbi:hypothetical protein BDZ94DRAFT_1172768 [Collybia nuda]|uniref:RRM Nup35-type domain-containing protein n=1 Tax=Collybia nuda TaxID=64659 RepID=A0A9P6CFE2_9AGAR|nr:hypothetical protein BDZ94DRAFT_1172768 [Collybia nuda]